MNEKKKEGGAFKKAQEKKQKPQDTQKVNSVPIKGKRWGPFPQKAERKGILKNGKRYRWVAGRGCKGKDKKPKKPAGRKTGTIKGSRAGGNKQQRGKGCVSEKKGKWDREKKPGDG